MKLKPGTRTYVFIQWAIFPVSLIGFPWLVYELIARGVHFAVATYGVVVLLGLSYYLFEHLLPYRPQWNRLAGDLSNDILSGTVAYILMPKFLRPLYFAALAGSAVWLASFVGQELWPSHWPLLAQLVLLLLAADAGRYWGHRFSHQIPLLWRFHAVHHSATRLWFFNATRQHPLDKLWFMGSEFIVPILLGVNGEVFSLYLVVTAVCGFTQHCNIDIKLGYLYWIFNVGELHRWHHSKIAGESDNNYGNNLIVYDRLFGTFFHPEASDQTRQVGSIGLLNPDYPKNYWGQLMAPFARQKLDKANSHLAVTSNRTES